MSQHARPSAPSHSGHSPELPRHPHLFYNGRILRAGWGLLLFLLVVFACMAIETLLLVRLAHLHDTPHTVLIPRDALPSLVIATALTLATLVLGVQEQRPFSTYGLRGPNAVRLALGGALTGIVLLSALVLLLHHMDLVLFRGQAIFGIALEWKFGLFWLGFYVLVAYVEEMFARGYLQYTLTRGLAWVLRHYFAAASGVRVAFWISGLVLTVLFALSHRLNRGETSMGVVSAGLFGLLLLVSLWRTGSLWWALGFHTAWDWAQSFLWGTPDSGLLIRDHFFVTEPTAPALQSGGAAGPEGSIYAIGAYLAAFGVLMLLHRRQPYPELWAEAANDADDTDQMLPDPGRATRS